MAGYVKSSPWVSDMKLNNQDDDTESTKSSCYENDKPEQTSVGPFMCDLFEKQLYTDVDFVSKHTKEAISAHRVVVASKCSHFESLLFGKQQNEARGMKLQVEINYKPFRVFKDIVKYFYTGDIHFPDLRYVLDACTIADCLEVPELVDQCEAYVDALELNEDNACSTLQTANEKYAEQLKERCIEYIKKNTLQVISSPDFEKCSFTTAREICDLQDLNLVSEAEVLEAAVRWLGARPDHAKGELKKSLLKCVRFLSFSSKKFGDLVRRHPDLLSNADALAILVYLNDPKSKKEDELPDWVNRGHRTFRRGYQAARQIVKGRLKIPLRPASAAPQDLTRHTSVLQMRCVKGSHRINAIKFSLQAMPDLEEEVATLEIKAFVLPPRRFRLAFTKAVDSEQTTVVFDRGINVSDGQTVHLKVQFRAGGPARFFQFDDSGDFSSEHFECSVSSRPKEGRFFVIDEIEYTRKALPKFMKKSRQWLASREEC